MKHKTILLDIKEVESGMEYQLVMGNNYKEWTDQLIDFLNVWTKWEYSDRNKSIPGSEEWKRAKATRRIGVRILRAQESPVKFPSYGGPKWTDWPHYQELLDAHNKNAAHGNSEFCPAHKEDLIFTPLDLTKYPALKEYLEAMK